MRREYHNLFIRKIIQCGLPLHAQGILTGNADGSKKHGITPACAGNTSIELLNLS